MNLLSKVRILSRKSDLAMIQSMQVGNALQKKFPNLTIEYMTKSTAGDKDLKTPLSEMPNPGVFTDDLRKELIKNNCDIVVHSWKDLPLDLGKSTIIAGTLNREDQRDIIFVNKKNLNKIKVSKSISILSSSPRRIYNLKSFIPKYFPFQLENINFENIRGNIPTRFRKFLENDLDSIVIAKAAIDRLITNPFPEFINLSNQIKNYIDKCIWMITPLSLNPSSPGQGSLGIEIKKENTKLSNAISSISESKDMNFVNMERKILKNYGGGCHQKIGVSFFETNNGIIHSEKGETEEGKKFYEWKIHQHRKINAKKIDPKYIFPFNIKDYSFFDRIEIEENINKISKINDHCIWISRKSSLPKGINIPKNNIIWTSGLKTWKALANRGLWVNGCADGLGEDLDPNISSLISLPWIKLTHDTAPNSKIKKILKTYKLLEKTNSFDFKEKKYFFWMSSSAFNLAVKNNPIILDAYHACGPGNTYKEIKKVIKDPTKLYVYLSYEDWKKEITNE